MKKNNVALSVALACGLVLTGCSTGGSVAEDPEQSTSQNTEASTTEATPAGAEEEAEAEPEEEDSSSPVFGDTYEWDNGLKMTVSEPEPFKPSESAAGAEDASLEAVLFTISVENASSEPFDPTIIMVSAASGGQEGSMIIDSAQNVMGSPTTTVPAGRSVEFKLGFAVADPDDIIMDVTPGFEYDSATYTS